MLLKNKLKFIYHLFRLFFKVKFIFKKHNKFDILIFDCETSKHLEYLLSQKKYTVLKIRKDKIDLIFVNFFTISYVLKNFFKRKLKTNYFLAIILQINPKLVITQYDNSAEFHLISKILLNKNIRTIAAQGAIRTINNTKSLKKNFFINEYLVFSNYEKNFYTKNNFEVKKFYPVGSIKSAAALDFFEKNSSDLSKKYDICIISELIKVKNLIDEKYMIMLRNFIQNIKNFAKQKKLKVIIAGAGNKNSEIAKMENDFYNEIFGENDYEIDHSDKEYYPSYKNILKSKLVVGTHSTLIREALGLNKKVFVYNYLPETEYLFQFDDFFVLKHESSEDNFFSLISEIYNLDTNKYFLKTNPSNLFMSNPKKVKDFFQSI